MSGAAGAILRKEIRELSRDRKAIFLSILMPIFIYPVTLSLTSSLEHRERARTQGLVFDVALTGETGSFREEIERYPGLAVVRDGTSDPDTLRARVRKGELDAWVHAPADSATVTVIFHGPNDRSADARDRIEDLLDTARAAERDRRYREAGGSGSLGDLLEVAERDVATEEEAGGAKAGRFVPFLLIVTLFIGGASLSTDLVAGEKERGTLETLYLTPVERIEIAKAKFAFVVAATAITGMLNLGSLLVCYRMGWIGEPGGGGLVVSVAGVVTAFLLVLPLAALVGGVLLGISAHARSLKEAQYYMTPAMILAFVPGAFAMSQEVRLGAFTALLPVANVGLAIRDGLLGPVPAPLLALVAAASVAWGVLAMRWTARVLSREETILGFDPEPVFASTAAGRRRAALLGMAVTVLGFFYVGNVLQHRDLAVGLALSLWVLLPLLAGGTLRFAWSGGALPEVLSLRAPPGVALLGAALLGLGAVLPIADGLMRLQGFVLPLPEEFTKAFDQDLGLGSLPLPLFYLLLAVSPGICEELVFRGAFLGLLRRVASLRFAVLVSSAFFGLIHLSVFRFLPTALLGVVMAAITVRTRSIFPAMLFHMVYNGTSVTLGRFETPSWMEGAAGGVVSAVLLVAGWRLLQSARSD